MCVCVFASSFHSQGDCRSIYFGHLNGEYRRNIGVIQVRQCYYLHEIACHRGWVLRLTCQLLHDMHEPHDRAKNVEKNYFIVCRLPD